MTSRYVWICLQKIAKFSYNHSISIIASGNESQIEI